MITTVGSDVLYLPVKIYENLRAVCNGYVPFFGGDLDGEMRDVKGDTYVYPYYEESGRIRYQVYLRSKVNFEVRSLNKSIKAFKFQMFPKKHTNGYETPVPEWKLKRLQSDVERFEQRRDVFKGWFSDNISAKKPDEFIGETEEINIDCFILYRDAYRV